MDIKAIKARAKERREDRVCNYVFCQQVDRDIPALIAEVERLQEIINRGTNPTPDDNVDVNKKV